MDDDTNMLMDCDIVFDLVVAIQNANAVYQRVGAIKNTTAEALDAAYTKVLECDDALLTYLEDLKEGRESISYEDFSIKPRSL